MKTALALALAGLLASPAMAQPSQFDLICRGTEAARPGGARQPYEAHYRIDLASMQWCAETCAPIRDVSAERILLADEEPSADQPDNRVAFVSRLTGEFSDVLIGPGSTWDRKARCEVAPFSGLTVATP